MVAILLDRPKESPREKSSVLGGLQLTTFRASSSDSHLALSSVLFVPPSAPHPNTCYRAEAASTLLCPPLTAVHQSGNQHKRTGSPGITPASWDLFLSPFIVCLRAMARPQQHLILHETSNTRKACAGGSEKAAEEAASTPEPKQALAS